MKYVKQTMAPGPGLHLPVRAVLLTMLLLNASVLSAEARGLRVQHEVVKVDLLTLQESFSIFDTRPGSTESRRLTSVAIAVPIGSPEPFLAVTAVWTVGNAQPSEASVAVRASRDGTDWTDWDAITVDADTSTADESVGGLLFLPKESRWVQFRVTLPGAKNVASALTSFRGVFISPGDRVPLVAESLPAPTPSEATKPPVVTRTGWGCPDGQSSPGWTPKYTTTTHLIVHHTVNSNTSTDWAAVVRSIFALHTYTNGWGDIGYNYLVDPNGVVYEGRAGGDDVIGAHFTCANTNTMGVAFLGTFTSVLPTAKAWDAVTRLLAWKAEPREIDPLGSTWHTPTQLLLQNISGHRDANSTRASGPCPKGTECPGDALYPMLNVLRDDVAGQVTPPPPAIHVISPNGGEIWPVGSPHTITWTPSRLDPSGEVRIFLSRDGGKSLDPEPIAVVGPGATTATWTPAPADATTAARLFVGNSVDGAWEVSDRSDENFSITNRRRPIRKR